MLSPNGVSVTEDLAQDASLLQDFLTECGELLEQLDQDLVAMESSFLPMRLATVTSFLPRFANHVSQTPRSVI